MPAPIAACLVAASVAAVLGAPDERAALTGDLPGWWAGSVGRR